MAPAMPEGKTCPPSVYKLFTKHLRFVQDFRGRFWYLYLRRTKHLSFSSLFFFKRKPPGVLSGGFCIPPEGAALPKAALFVGVGSSGAFGGEENHWTFFARCDTLSLRGDTMSVPRDPMILLSYINTQLRDNYSDLHELCRALDLDEVDLVVRLREVNYEYDPMLNRFL
jgi:hypothetical protein